MQSMLKWKRTHSGDYVSTCGKYLIKKFDTIMRGNGALWELHTPAGIEGADMKPLLRTAKAMAQKIENRAK